MIYEYEGIYEKENQRIILGFKISYTADFRLIFKNTNEEYDSHDLRMKIENVLRNFDDKVYDEYAKKYVIGRLIHSMYLFDNFKEIAYVKFPSANTCDILCKDEVQNMLCNNK